MRQNKKREYKLYYEFWEHAPGCTKTRFYIAGWEWRNKEVPDYSYEQNFYKGFRLKDIQEEVMKSLTKILMNFLRTNDFDCKIFPDGSRFGYIKGKVIIGW